MSITQEQYLALNMQLLAAMREIELVKKCCGDLEADLKAVKKKADWCESKLYTQDD